MGGLGHDVLEQRCIVILAVAAAVALAATYAAGDQATVASASSDWGLAR
jgi:hypothetical protein